MDEAPPRPQAFAGALMGDVVTPRGRVFVALWALALVLVYAISGCAGVRALHRYRAETEQLRRVALESETFAPRGARPIVPANDAATVTVGVFVLRIGGFDVRDSAWTADFDVWFRFRDLAFDPGETFQVANGEVARRDKLESIDRGGEHYERYRVQAKLTKFFDPARLPFGDEALSIQIEDASHGASELRYVADEQASGVSRLAAPPNLVLVKTIARVKTFEYASSFGRSGAPEARSRFVLVTLGNLPGFPAHLRMFQALYASVAIALIVFFIKPSWVDPRFGLGVGAAFAAIANNIQVVSNVPSGDRFSLAAMVYAVGLGTIFLTLVASAISLYMEDALKLEKLRSRFDAVSFCVFLIGYVALNVIFPLAALP